MPQKGKSPKIFYGWWIVFVCFICAMTSGIVGYGFTAFFNPVVLEFGWSYAAVSFAASLRGAETGILSPVLGFLVERWSTRWILFIGAILTGVGLIFLSRVSSLVQFYGAWVIISMGTSCCSSGVVNPAVNNWFKRDMGKAMGILTTGFALSGLFVPVIYNLIESFGWREALIFIAGAFFIVCVPLTFIIKDKPEKYGYLPDGDSEVLNSAKTESKTGATGYSQPELNISTKQALKSRTFWHITGVLTLQAVVYLAVINHIMPFLKTVNIDGYTASFFAGAIPVLSIMGRLSAGWLSDRFDRKMITASSYVLMCIGTLSFDYVKDSTLWLLFLTVLVFSFSVGSITTMRGILTIEYFGRSRFASIYGIIIGITSFGGMLGPLMAGWTFDIWKSYHYCWLIFTVINILALVLMITTPRIQPKQYLKS